jgi:gamma-glutamyltranspeptidase / glutathione hydrolase
VDDFYRGATAALITRDMEERGGLVTADDLAGVRVTVREPIEILWQGHRILSAPPPAGGVQTLLALRILERAPIPELADAERTITRALALRLAFRERERWPDHPDDLTPAILRWLVSDERIEGILDRLASGADRAIPLDSLGEAGDTTHLSVTDGSGRCVAITQSIQSVFGAKTGCAAAGFFYNNFLKTCPRERHAYRLGPRSLPQSNAAPTIALGRSGAAWMPRLLLGAAGSRRIASSIVQVIDATIGHGASLPEAVRGPRLHALLGQGAWVEAPLLREGGAAAIEAKLGPIRALPELAYQAGAIHAIAFDGRLAVGAADPRRDGVAIAVDPPSQHFSRIERGRSPLL